MRVLQESPKNVVDERCGTRSVSFEKITPRGTKNKNSRISSSAPSTFFAQNCPEGTSPSEKTARATPREEFNLSRSRKSVHSKCVGSYKKSLDSPNAHGISLAASASSPQLSRRTAYNAIQREAGAPVKSKPRKRRSSTKETGTQTESSNLVNRLLDICQEMHLDLNQKSLSTSYSSNSTTFPFLPWHKPLERNLAGERIDIQRFENASPETTALDVEHSIVQMQIGEVSIFGEIASDSEDAPCSVVSDEHVMHVTNAFAPIPCQDVVSLEMNYYNSSFPRYVRPRNVFQTTRSNVLLHRASFRTSNNDSPRAMTFCMGQLALWLYSLELNL